MKFMIWLLLILSGAVALSLIAGSNDGYILLVHAPYRIEISINLAIVLLILSFVVLHVSLKMLQYTLSLPETVNNFNRRRKLLNAHSALIESQKALVEGRYNKAEKAAVKAQKLGGDAGLSNLLAARAAHYLKQFAKRDLYLAEAERLAPKDAVARLLTQAELLLDERQYSRALQPLLHLEKIESQHPPTLKLLLKTHQRLGNWEHVLSVLAQLDKRGAIESIHRQHVLTQAHQHLLERRSDNLADLLDYWKKIPESDRTQTPLARLAARCFIKMNDGAMAAQIIESGLNKIWDSQLAALYGDCISQSTVKQLKQAEIWLKQHEADAGLLLALGKLCMRQELWGKSQSYLEASLSVEASSEAHCTLARLLERIGKQEAADQHYRLALNYAMR